MFGDGVGRITYSEGELSLTKLAAGYRGLEEYLEGMSAIP
jgi:hypothetical protein